MIKEIVMMHNFRESSVTKNTWVKYIMSKMSKMHNPFSVDEDLSCLDNSFNESNSEDAALRKFFQGERTETWTRPTNYNNMSWSE